MRRNIVGRKREPWKGVVGGLISGLVATVVMTQFQNLWNKASETFEEKEEGKQSNEPGTSLEKGQREEEQKKEQKEDATMKTAGKIAAAAGYDLSHEEKKKAGPFVHYGFGTAMGATYALAKETVPRRWQKMHPALSGAGFGTALFLGADEVTLPALKLADKPSKTPASSHLYGWASHLIYGLTVATVYKAVRHLL